MHVTGEVLLHDLLVFVIPMIFSFGLHEWGHAWAAVRLGDMTPREEGKDTPNPIAHIDPIGTLAVPIFSIVLYPGVVPMGWPKPVNLTPYRFSRRVKLKVGVLLSAAAGPAMNLLLGFGAAVLLQALLHYGRMPGGKVTKEILETLVHLNLMLFLFNLIPLPPLDGGRVLKGFMPASLRDTYEMLERFAPIFVAILLLSGLGGAVIAPGVDVLSRLIYRAAYVLFPFGNAADYLPPHH